MAGAPARVKRRGRRTRAPLAKRGTTRRRYARGWTALTETVILGDGGPTYRTILRLLLDAGADTDIPDTDGVTPLAHARRLGFDALAAMLEKAGARA